MLLNVRIITRAKQVKIEKIGLNDYKVRLTKLPENNKANKQLVKMLANYFNVAKGRVRIKKGIKNSRKIIAILPC